jgi:hypothetical protein
MWIAGPWGVYQYESRKRSQLLYRRSLGRNLSDCHPETSHNKTSGQLPGPASGVGRCLSAYNQWDGPPPSPKSGIRGVRRRRPVDLHTIGIDLGKTVLHLVGFNLRGEVAVRKIFSREQLLVRP